MGGTVASRGDAQEYCSLAFKGTIGLIGLLLAARGELLATSPESSAEVIATAPVPGRASSQSYSPLVRPPEIPLPGDGDIRGELASMDSEGHILRRMTGAGY